MCVQEAEWRVDGQTKTMIPGTRAVGPRERDEATGDSRLRLYVSEGEVGRNF